MTTYIKEEDKIKGIYCKLTGDKIDLFKGWVTATSNLIDEGTVTFGNLGMKILMMDASQIALVDGFIPTKSFAEYKIEKEENVGINFVELKKITQRIKNDTSMEIHITTKLTITLTGKTTRTFTLGLLEPQTIPRSPKIDFDSEIKMSAEIIQDPLKDIDAVGSNKATISIKKNSTNISSDNETSNVAIEISDEQLMKKETKEDSTTTFSLDYLKNIINSADPKSIITIHLKSDAPMKVSFFIKDEAEMSYFLAPRIESTQ